MHLRTSHLALSSSPLHTKHVSNHPYRNRLKPAVTHQVYTQISEEFCNGLHCACTHLLLRHADSDCVFFCLWAASRTREQNITQECAWCDLCSRIDSRMNACTLCSHGFVFRGKCSTIRFGGYLQAGYTCSKKTFRHCHQPFQPPHLHTCTEETAQTETAHSIL